MPRGPDSRRGASSTYFLRFGFSAAVLASLTLLMVLVVLPRRYVLGSGFRESGISFPAHGAPFTPGMAVARGATPVRTVVASKASAAPGSASPGPAPADLLWTRAIPLLDAGEHADAAALFEDYLAEFPDDRSVLREYAVVLHWAGRPGGMVDVLEGLLGGGDDREVRLVLARALRDQGRTVEADAHYRTLWVRSQDPTVALEWSRSWSWAGRYQEAMDVLRGVLVQFPGDAELEVELARLLYYSGELVEAASILAALDRTTLERTDGLGLRADVAAALAVPADPVLEPSTLFEALRARDEGRADDAEALFREALAAAPEDPEVWQAWADFLEYDRQDYDGARDALLRVRVLEGPAAGRELRIARLEIWSGDAEGGESRLIRLLEAGSGGSRPEEGDADTTRADALTLLGDLRRWDGDRVAAHRRYREALDARANHSDARDGLKALRLEVARVIRQEEGGGGLSTLVSGLGDTDDFRRFDLRGEGGGVTGSWAWRGGLGYRWLGGIDLSGGDGRLQGAWGDVEVARWWRLGTLRTALRVGADDVAGIEAVLGAEVRLVRPGGSSWALELDRGPGYLLLGTLQSGLAGYRYDRVTVRSRQTLAPGWSLNGDAQLARLSSDRSELEPSFRFSVSAGVARNIAPGVSWGAELRALLFTEAAAFSGGRPLFWDPERVVSGGPFLAVRHTLSPTWSLQGRAGAGAAFMNEARIEEPTWAPQLNLELGLEHAGRRVRGRGELFYLQGQFQGYRSWGVRFRLGPGTRLGGERR
ncbi:MAG: tetratricopeptide repeat protein [Gemmatimonadota bacterium]